MEHDGLFNYPKRRTESSMKAQIERELSKIVGLPLKDAGRVADLEWFSFGRTRIVRNHRGVEREVGEYAIHVQCAWRITKSRKIVVASRDRYVPREGWEGSEEDFDWDKVGENRCDQRIRSLFDGTRAIVVESAEGDNLGGFRLFLSHDYILEVFPDDSEDDEHWRLFEPAVDSPHFVVTGGGIECSED